MATADECSLWRTQLGEKIRFLSVWEERERFAEATLKNAFSEWEYYERERDRARREWEGDPNNTDKQTKLAGMEEQLRRAIASRDAAIQQRDEARQTRSALADRVRELEYQIREQC
jgi:hypothetical protein